MTILGIDVSHNNNVPNWAVLKAGGFGFVVIKATQGITFVDPAFATSRAGAHAAGLVVGAYHFASITDPVAEANHFIATVGALTPGELLFLDMETSVPGVDLVAWSATFLMTVSAHYGYCPHIYMNQSYRDMHNWSTVANLGAALWLAKYDNSPLPSPSGAWPTLAFKQFTDSATVPGESGQVDEDAFEGDATQLASYGYQGSSPVSTSSPLSDADAALVASKVWGWLTSGGKTQAQDRLTGVDTLQLPAIKAEEDSLVGQVTVLTAKVTALTAKVDTLNQTLGFITQTLAALPAATATALPAMLCQGNPGAVAAVIGSKLSAP